MLLYLETYIDSGKIYLYLDKYSLPKQMQLKLEIYICILFLHKDICPGIKTVEVAKYICSGTTTSIYSPAWTNAFVPKQIQLSLVGQIDLFRNKYKLSLESKFVPAL